MCGGISSGWVRNCFKNRGIASENPGNPATRPIFETVSKGWPELKTWALEWLRRIRLLYRLNDRRLAVQQDATAFGEADGCLRQAVAAMKTQMETELARADL